MGWGSGGGVGHLTPAHLVQNSGNAASVSLTKWEGRRVEGGRGGEGVKPGTSPSHSQSNGTSPFPDRTAAAPVAPLHLGLFPSLLLRLFPSLILCLLPSLLLGLFPSLTLRLLPSRLLVPGPSPVSSWASFPVHSASVCSLGLIRSVVRPRSVVSPPIVRFLGLSVHRSLARPHNGAAPGSVRVGSVLSSGQPPRHGPDLKAPRALSLSPLSLTLIDLSPPVTAPTSSPALN